MKKTILSVAVGASLLFAGFASAATISDPLFSNGDVSIDAQGNSSVSGTFTLQVGSNEVCEVLRTQAAPQAFTDTQVGGSLGYQQGTYTGVPFNVKVSPNTGTYYPTVQCAGIWGGNHSIDGADNVVASGNLGTVRVTANSTSGSTGSVSSIDSLAALVASLTAQVQAILHPVTPPAPTASAACTEFNSDVAGSTMGAKTQGNIVLQGFLLSKGMSIAPLTNGSGTPFGFYGPITASAVSAFKLANGCN